MYIYVYGCVMDAWARHTAAEGDDDRVGLQP